ncbi:MAG: hypothetical protein HUJ30_03705 [Gammaproteobacteria bacterium]|nr:hypothetical protein [Gammaproteobacteria bacterium]
MSYLFKEREQAGIKLAETLKIYSSRSDVIVLSISSRGVITAYAIARSINAPLDLLMIKRLVSPHDHVSTLGALSSGGHHLLNETLIKEEGISRQQVSEIEKQGREELARREKLYRGMEPQLNIRDHVVILVDDGSHTGLSIEIAIASLLGQKPKEIIVAVPVISRENADKLTHASKVVSLLQFDSMPDRVSWYETDDNINSEQIQELLAQSREYKEKDFEIPAF